MKKINLTITGCLGRMGQQLIKSSKSAKNFILVSVTENRIISKKVSGLIPQLNSLFAFKNSNVIIDFTIPKCTLEVLKIASKLKKRVVIGTTGFSKKEENLIKKYSKKIPILKAGNMSLGINLLIYLTEIASKSLGNNFLSKVFEIHHKHKKDHPSGTALMLGKGIAVGKNKNFYNSMGKKYLNKKTSKNGKKINFNCNVVLISVGRKPNTKNLNLEAIGVSLDNKKRIKVNNNFQTNVDSVYAIGDVIKGPMLAHKAEEEGIAIAELIAGQSGHVNYDTIPGVIYTFPEVASIGKTEEQLKNLNTKYKIGKFPFMANSRAKAINEPQGFVKIIADEKTDKVLSVSMISAVAGTMIAEAAIAMEFGASAEDIARTCHAHPTHSEAVKEAALAVDKRPIHF